jgi:hypothetical protein
VARGRHQGFDVTGPVHPQPGRSGDWPEGDGGSARFVVAEMNTHHFMFRGAGRDRTEARAALLSAWARHRSEILARYPERASSLPASDEMEKHFRLYYLEFTVGAGYRDGERVA